MWRLIEPDAEGSRPAPVEGLRKTLRRRGFVLIRGAIPARLLTAARERILHTLEAVGEIVRCGESVSVTGLSHRGKCETVPGELWSEVTRSPEVLALAHGDASAQLRAAMMGEDVRAECAVYVRGVGPGLGSAVHTDYPPATPPHPSALKIWIALTPVLPHVSGLFLLPMRGPFSFLQQRNDAAAARFRQLAHAGLEANFAGWLRGHGVVVLTAQLRPGDAFIFESMCPHGSFDNTCDARRLRLSCDVGWQATRRAKSDHVGPPPADPAAYRCFVGSRLASSLT